MPSFLPNTSGVNVPISTSMTLWLYFLFFSFSCSLKIVAVCFPWLDRVRPGNCINCTYGRLYEAVLIMSRVVLSFVSLTYFETDHVLIMKVYSCVR